MNQQLFLSINHGVHAVPDWVWSCLTLLGHTGVVLALLSVFLFKPAHQRLLWSALLCAVLAGLASTALKESFQVLRPPAVLAVDSFYLIGHKLELVSFPSGHTTTAFAIASLLVLGLRPSAAVQALLWGLALLVGLSRIAVGAHWPLDVLGGALLGILCGALSWWLTGRLAAWFLRRQPEPSLFKKHQRPWSRAYGLLLAALYAISSASLFFIDTGYPLAEPLQWLAASLGCVLSLGRLFSNKAFNS